MRVLARLEELQFDAWWAEQTKDITRFSFRYTLDPGLVRCPPNTGPRRPASQLALQCSNAPEEQLMGSKRRQTNDHGNVWSKTGSTQMYQSLRRIVLGSHIHLCNRLSNF
ncbi:hypothetical protein DPMN_031710 [Dreissena polymorpha]|uniref:Uncharacterized protein n=1 Tax=Dreissena polymorpha TaxID=45954 RepID=A0A9D4RHB6_DREPO|nr:hypothetical protein DPMN_031710 [Dreissena polymorpha]